MKILITGAAGYIGSSLAKHFSHNDNCCHIIFVDNLSRGDYNYLQKYLDRKSFRFFNVDIRDKCLLENVFKEDLIDVVVHLAALPGMERCRRNPYDAVTTNVYGTYNIVELARKYDVGKVIFTSSAAVYGNPVEVPIREDHPLCPTNLYGVTKLAAEKLLYVYYHNYGLKTVILRFGNVYGVGLYTYWETVIPKFVRQALTGQPLTIYGDGLQSRDFVHVWDVVQAIELVLKANIAGEVFNIASGKPVSINLLADMISKIVERRFNKKVSVTHLPPRKGETYIRDFCLSIDKIRSRLGFKPMWTLERGINQLIDFYLNRVAK